MGQGCEVFSFLGADDVSPPAVPVREAHGDVAEMGGSLCAEHHADRLPVGFSPEGRETLRPAAEDGDLSRLREALPLRQGEKDVQNVRLSAGKIHPPHRAVIPPGDPGKIFLFQGFLFHAAIIPATAAKRNLASAGFFAYNGEAMRTYDAGKCDIVVIGAGHAGIEAALAAARLGLDTVCFTVSLDAVGNMPCNPAIGGTGKGHLVRELDALGGEMGRAADKACIQYRMLNRGKGPAVHSLRAQADRRKYQEVMKHTLELQENLRLKQGEIVSIGVEDGRVSSVTTDKGAVYEARAVVIASGTYLGGRTITGETVRDSGPDGLAAALPLTDCLRDLGLRMRRFKTGTPPRVNARTVDFSQMQVQYGDEDIEPFSFSTEEKPQNRVTCWLTYTNAETHRIIRENLDRSPLYAGVIEGVGPRYCPSIETKIVTFPDKERHQLFIEPMGLNTEELYIQGFSSSLPEDVQIAMVHSLPGLEHAEITRPAYAIEYDCLDPTELTASLMCKKIPGLFGAGQFNGSSGYEEAAAQGLVAGVNAARYVQGQEPFILRRSDGYIGTLIDDLVTKGTEEPYRMMTSRSEYRLIHRQDNADRRLAPLGHAIGLVSGDQLRAVEEKFAAVDAEIKRLQKNHLYDLLKRPENTYASLAEQDPDRRSLSRAVTQAVEISVKYEGYIRRQQKEIEQFSRMEDRPLPEDMDYAIIPGIRTEAKQKLTAIRPASFGQAGRISGVSPADLTALMIWLEKDKNA